MRDRAVVEIAASLVELSTKYSSDPQARARSAAQIIVDDVTLAVAEARQISERANKVA
jgi:hypothetical protein